MALVTGTNGKTTTTRLLTVGLGAAGDVVVSNDTGSNMPPGLVAALAGTDAPRAVLETDEVYLPRVLTATAAATVILLNLSRDQLDRTNEVRMVAGRWRAALAAAPRTHVVANADDPLVVWGAGAAPRRALGGGRPALAARRRGCPSCEGRIEFGRAAGGRARHAGSPAPNRRRRSWSSRTARPSGEWADGRMLPGAAGVARPLQPVQRADGGGGRRGVRRRRRGGALRHGIRAGGGRALHRARLRRRTGPAHAGQEPRRLGRAARPGGRLRRAARGQHQRPDRPTGPTPAGCGTCPTSGWPAVPWSPPATASATFRSASTTAGSPTPPSPILSAPSTRSGAATGRRVDVIGNYTAFHDLLGAPK